MRIGVFGGSFNPFHKGHLKISQIAIKKLKLDQLWIVPTKQNPLKNNILTSYEERMRGVEDGVGSTVNKIRVKNFELKSKSTYNMLSLIKKTNPKDDIIFIMGADNVVNFHKWDNFKRLIRNFSFAIFSRDECFLKIRSSKSFQLMNKVSSKKARNLIFRIKNVNISSTQLRKSK